MKTKTLELTEREIDHIMISLECSCEYMAKVCIQKDDAGLPSEGAHRTYGRYKSIHGKLAKAVEA